MFRRVLILAALVLGCGVSVSAQGYRIGDAQVVGSSLTSTAPVIPLQATVAVCTNPANAVPCTNKATTFTSVTIAVSCPTSTQVVLAGTTTCVTQTDSRGNWGAWVAAGNYDVTYTLPTGQSFGPYTISVGIPPGTALSPGPLTLTGIAANNCLQTAGGGLVTGNGIVCAGPAYSAAGELNSMSPSASAATNTTGLQNTLNVGGKASLQTAGTYSVNGVVTIGSNTHLSLNPGTILQQAANTNGNMIVNAAYTKRGFISGTFTYSSGASGCTNGTQFVQFSNGNGYGGYGSISVVAGVPTGNVTIINPGAYYSSTPTTANILTSLGASACTVNTAVFTGGAVTNPITAVTLTWNSNRPEEVTVTWPSTSPFWNGGNGTAVQAAFVTISNAAPSGSATQPESPFNGTFLVETIPTATTFTFRIRRNPTCAVLTCNGTNQTIGTDHGGSVVAMVADQNIVIEGGKIDYNGDNNNANNGTNQASSVMIFAAANVEIKNVNFLRARQETVMCFACTNVHIHDISDVGDAIQFFECQGPCYNVSVDHIETTGNDDGMSFLTRIPTNGPFANVALSFGDVQNSGFSHIDRHTPNNSNTAATATTLFFGSQNEYMGGIYSRDIAGTPTLFTPGPTTDTSCVAFGGLSATQNYIDTLEVENINGNCTFSLRIGATSPAILNVSHATVKNVTCNPQQNSGNEGEECIQIPTTAVIAKLEIEKLNYNTPAHTTGSETLIEIGGTINELDIIDAQIITPPPANPAFLLTLDGPAVITNANIIRLRHTASSAAIVDGSTSGVTWSVTDSNVVTNEMFFVSAGNSGQTKTYNIQNCTCGNMANGIVQFGTFSGTSVVNINKTASNGLFVNDATQTNSTITIRDSVVTSSAMVQINTTAGTWTKTVVLRDNTGTGLTGGLVFVPVGTSATGTILVYSSGNSMAGAANTPATNASSATVQLSDTGERGAWAFSSVGVQQIAPFTCQGLPVVVTGGFNNTGTISGASYCSFTVTVGTGAANSTGTLTMPFTAPLKWTCTAWDVSSLGGFYVQPTSSSATQVGMGNFSTGAVPFAASNWTNSHVLLFQCAPQ